MPEKYRIHTVFYRIYLILYIRMWLSSVSICITVHVHIEAAKNINFCEILVLVARWKCFLFVAYNVGDKRFINILQKSLSFITDVSLLRKYSVCNYTYNTEN